MELHNDARGSERAVNVDVSVLARLFEALYSDPDDSGGVGPVAPHLSYWQRVRWIRRWWVVGPSPEPWLNAGPQPEPWVVAGPGVPREVAFPQAWKGIAIGSLVTDRFISIAQIAEATGLQEGGVQRQISQFVDDICGTPPRLRWPLPFPWPGPKRDFTMEPAALIALGVHFFKASESIGDDALVSTFVKAGNQLAQIGLERLVQRL
jgi:hypothetical protein